MQKHKRKLDNDALILPTQLCLEERDPQEWTPALHRKSARRDAVEITHLKAIRT